MNTERSTPRPASDHQDDATNALETFDTWAQALRQNGLLPLDAASRQQTPAMPPTLPAQPPSPVSPRPAPQPVAHGDTPLTRPIHRPPLALLHVVDDGRDGGETIRMRAARLVIGRDAGDIVVPHDLLMDTPHAALERLTSGGWRLVDMGSANGTFVRVMQARLRDGSEVIIGATRLRLRLQGPGLAQLVEHTPATITAGRKPPEERGHSLVAHRVTLGRRGHGGDIEIDDAFVSPQHAECTLTSRGWQVRNLGVNGLWVRITSPVALCEASQFLCGEQRFVFEPLR